MHWHEQRVLSQLSDLQFNKHHRATPGVTSHGPTGSHQSSLCLDRHSSFVGTLPCPTFLPSIRVRNFVLLNVMAAVWLAKLPFSLRRLEFSSLFGSGSIAGGISTVFVDVESRMRLTWSTARAILRVPVFLGGTGLSLNERSINSAPANKQQKVRTTKL